MYHTSKEIVESCGICHQLVNAVTDKTVTCSGSPGCGRCFHTLCAFLNLTMWAALTSDGGLKWFCADCRRNKHPKQESTKDTLEDIMARIDQLEAKVDLGFARCHDQLMSKMGRQSDLTQSIDITRPSIEPQQSKHCSTITPPSTANNERESREKMKTLPEDLWEKIFHYLSVHQLFQVRLTCRLWNRIVGTSLVMDRMELCFPKDITLSSGSKEVSALKSTQYKRMVLNDVTLIDPNIWWPKVCANLHTLTVTNCTVPLDELLQMLGQATNLKELTVNIDNPSVLPKVKIQLKSLEKLDLRGYAHLETLEMFKNMCTRLKTLKLPTFYNHIGRIRIEQVYKSAFEFIMSLKETLQNLTVRGGSENFCKKVIWLSNNTIALKHLTCRLEDTSIDEYYYLMQPWIESLHLTNRHCGTRLKTLGEKHRLLKKLKLKIDSTIYTSECFKDLQELQHLKVNALRLRKNAEFSYSGQVLRSLISLNFRNHTLHNNWLMAFPFLNFLKLESCEIDNWKEFIMECSKLKYLHHLELSEVSPRKNSNDDCFPKINPSLRVLKLAGCRMSPSMFYNMFSECFKLEEISLKYMQLVNDVIINRLVKQSGRHLKIFKITSCTITEAVVQNIIVFCDRIKKITIQECGEMTDRVLQQLKCHRYARVEYRNDPFLKYNPL